MQAPTLISHPPTPLPQRGLIVVGILIVMTMLAALALLVVLVQPGVLPDWLMPLSPLRPALRELLLPSSFTEANAEQSMDPGMQLTLKFEWQQSGQKSTRVCKGAWFQIGKAYVVYDARCLGGVDPATLSVNGWRVSRIEPNLPSGVIAWLAPHSTPGLAPATPVSPATPIPTPVPQ